jgi:hypothetical protein
MWWCELILIPIHYFLATGGPEVRSKWTNEKKGKHLAPFPPDFGEPKEAASNVAKWKNIFFLILVELKFVFEFKRLG